MAVLVLGRKRERESAYQKRRDAKRAEDGKGEMDL